VAEQRQNFVSAAPADEAPFVDAANEQVAILVCHGMGQQVPFETIDGVARLLRKEIRQDALKANLSPGPDEPKITTRIVAHDGLRLGRAEVQCARPGGGAVDLHIYEAYWAPLTAGKVGIGDVYTFLKDAGMSGLDKVIVPFERYMFDDWQSFKVRTFATLVQFGALLALLVSLGFISTTIVAIGAARALTRGASGWPSNSLMVDLTCDLILLIAFAVVLGSLYWCVWRRERTRNQRNQAMAASPRSSFLIWLILIALVLAVIAAIATGLLFLIHLSMAREDGADPWWTGSLAGFLADNSVCAALVVAAIWVVVLYINEKIRQFFVEYLGDVAAYIAPHTAHKFYEIRQAIQKSSREVARAVYSMKKTGSTAFLYDRIIVMGHSLGSVVAYDTINALMLDEATGAAIPVNSHDRTKHLITFGSPLDKTAFIFREQQQRESQVRESLAANVQPLIRDYRNRQGLTWINLWSPYDPISGHLDYYDATPSTRRPPNASPVDNRKDSYCNIPLYAHTMYWQSPLLGRVMFDAVKNR
jgi:hypothetical protein